MSQEQQQIFPYLQRLLNGAPVEWKPLGEVVKVIRGKSLKKSDVGLGDTPIILYGELYTTYGDYIKSIVSYTSFETAKTASIAHKTDILLPISSTTKEAQIGKASVLCVDSDIYVGGDALILRHSQNAGYLMYLLNCSWFERLKMRCVKGTTIMHLSPPQLMKIPIPIPPMEVQERIVEILDKFTELQAELQAELALREKQYIYFRDQLLSFEMLNRGGYSLNYIKYLPLGEVMDTVTDFTAAGSFANNAKNVKYLDFPSYAMLVRTTDLKQSFTNTKNFVYVDEHAFDYLWRVNLDKESIILPNVGNCGEVYYLLPKDLPTKNCVLGPNALLLRSQQVNNRYLYYLFQGINFQKELSKITSSTGQTKFNKTNLKKIIIPIPPMEEQERIVGILDRFETMVHSIKEGLPREIELRRKQYEYFRDQLLTFPKD